MRAFLLTLIFAAFAAPSYAALPPQFYQQARAEAESVVVIEVTGVEPPADARGYGDCRVSGRVAAVERGEAYIVGQEIEIAVPCKQPGARFPIGGVQWKDVPALTAAGWGRAFLNGGALALYQYDLLSEAP